MREVAALLGGDLEHWTLENILRQGDVAYTTKTAVEPKHVISHHTALHYIRT